MDTYEIINFLHRYSFTDKKLESFIEYQLEQGNKDIMLYIKDNLSYIIFNAFGRINVIKCLYKYEEFRSNIEHNIINYLRGLSWYQIKFLLMYDKFEFDLEKLINDNFLKVLDIVDFDDVLYLYYECNLKLTDENKMILNEKIKENPKIFIETFLLDSINVSDEYNSEIIDIIEKIMKEIMNIYQINFTDIKVINRGTSACVIEIGNKVLKVGDKRITYNIPNDKRILKPLIRINLKDYSNVEGTIEVQNKVRVCEDLSEEELYNLYKELRNRGIIFTDLRPANLGYLLSDNEFNYSKELNEDLSTRGLVGKNRNTLKKGDLVIIDTDYIYKENEPNIRIGTGNCLDFEKRYLKEKTITLSDLKGEEERIR